MKKSPYKQRTKKEKGCPEGHSMQTKLGKNGQPMRDPAGKIIKSCQLDKEEMKKIPDEYKSTKGTDPGKKGMDALAASAAGQKG